jgi:ABC-type Fe3+-hydroxamate transport system substrate-binding protein
VVEAAILATRTDFLPLDEIESEFRKLAVIVDKTGGDQEKKALAFLQEYVSRIAQARTVAGSAKEPAP